MVTCSNCGIENPDSRLFCAVCGTQLREAEPTAPDPTPPPASNTDSLFPDWLTTPGTSPIGASSAPKKSALPSWLQGAEMEPAATPPPVAPSSSPAAPGDSAPPSLEERTRVSLPPTPAPKIEELRPKARGTILPTPSGKPETWDEHLDFSDLPEWEEEKESETLSPFADAGVLKEPPMGAVETQGLLAGVAGAIPIEPIIRQARRAPMPAPPMTDEPLSAETDAATNLFAQIAGGAVRPEPITIPRSAARGTGFLHLLLLVAVLVGMGLKLGGWELFNPPTPSPTTQAYATTLATLPRDGTVLLAVEYDGSVLDELNPTLLSTFNQIRSIAPEGQVVVVSSSPVGEALAFQAWNASVAAMGGKTEWVSRGYVTGGITGQRATVADIPATMTLVVAGDSSAAQRWIEQLTVLEAERPLLAIVPASAEVMLRPYLASGQVDGAIATLTESAAYELTQNETGGTAWARLDTVTLAAMVIVLAMIVGWVRK
jgi:hypothetical protein